MANERVYAPYEYIGKVFYDWNNTTHEVKGIVFAYTFSEAAKKLDKEYGDELIEMRIVPCMESYVYEFGKDTGCIFDTSGVKVTGEDKPDPDFPLKVCNILVEEGQHDTKKFKLGDTIKYSPTEVMDILQKHIKEFN